jgi:hypothetical protein
MMKTFFKHLVGVLLTTARLTLGFLAGAVGLLASNASTTSSNDATVNAASGGVLNNRTGKLDDGTDPGGMY